MRRIVWALALAALASIAGCAAQSKESAFDDVSKRVRSQGVPVVRWNTNSAEDAEAAAAVNALLSSELTFGAVAQIAVLNNHELQATFEEIGIAQADLVQAGLLRNPVFDLSVRIPDGAPSKTYIDIGVAQNFLDIFFIPAKRKIAEEQLAQAKARVAQQVLTIATDTQIAFIQYQAAAQLLEIKKMAAEASAASLETARRLHDAGNINDLAYLTEQAQESRARIELAAAQASVQEAREHVDSLMGVSDAQLTWKAAAKLPDLFELTAPVTLAQKVALEYRQDLAAAREEIEIQGRALGLTEQTRFFSEANVGVDAERETDGQWRIGPSLSFPIPLFDQGQGAIPKTQAKLRQSRQRYTAMVVQIRSQVRAACDKLTNANAMARMYRDDLMPLQDKVLDQTQLHYNAMIVGAFQLLQAKQNQLEANEHYVESLRDFWISAAELERATGFTLAMPQSPTTQHASTGGALNEEHHHEAH
ncbi:MAG TPA: TolC family protein [Humisphaera sp.]|jgi:cobalt-zinc-cadmium efflux system outer membrane protein|nr:TolC family protein [Humisphaera sp.]